MADLRINEIRIDQPSGDSDEYFELVGNPGESLDGLTYIVIGDGMGGSGVIEAVIPLNGQVIPADGVFLAAESTFTLAPSDVDLSSSGNFLNFENSDNVTHLLVRDFTGALGQDLDTDNADPNGDGIGVLESAPWSAIVDSVALVEDFDDPDDELIYSTTIVGPNGSLVPGHVFRDTDGTGSFQIGQFNPAGGDDTPGASNSVSPPPVVTINEIRIDQPSTDNDEYFELFGAPGTDLTGLTYVVIGDGDAELGSGVIEAVVDLTGQTIPSDGIFLAAESTFTLGSPDLVASLNFENSDNVTHLLVQGFAGSDGDDLDTDDDGTLDVTPWSAVVDSVALVESFSSGELVYGSTTVGPDGSFVPAHVFRDPDGSGSFQIGQFNPAGGDDTPGALNAPPPPPATEVLIHEIQGSTNLADGTLVGAPGAADESPLLGELVRVTGVVTKLLPELGGFYVQEEDLHADDDPFSSEGIFVASDADVALGNLATVEGRVAEVEGETRITASSVTFDENSDGSGEVSATIIEFPTATVLTDTDGDSVANLEAYEGMLVTIPEAMSVTELFQLDRFGTIRVSSEGRLEQFTQSNAPDQAGFAQHQKDIAARSLIIDDGNDSQNPSPILVPDLGTDGTLDNGDVFRMGDEYTGLTGVLSYSEDSSSSEEPEYRLHLPEGDLNQVNGRDPAPEDVGSDYKVASVNVLNFFTTLDEFPRSEGVGPNGLSPRGADTNPQRALPGTGETDEYDRQLAKLTESLIELDSDVIGLIEIENDFIKGGISPTPAEAQDPRDIAIQELVNSINDTLGADIYDWVRPVDPETGELSEFVGDDAIAVGLIYDTSTTEIAEDTTATFLTDAGLDELGLDFGNPVFDGSGTSRAPLAATFEQKATGETFTVAVNHFKSKGSVSPFGNNTDQGDGQGNNNEARLQAAIAVDAWLDSDPTDSDDEDFLILGDLNAYAKEDPVTFLEGEGYTDLAKLYVGDDAYSFVFDGQQGTLDYILANQSMLSQTTGATEWHINADEPDAFDYNLEFGRDPDLLSEDAFRASDHDPLIIGLNLTSDDDDDDDDEDDDDDIADNDDDDDDEDDDDRDDDDDDDDDDDRDDDDSFDFAGWNHDGGGLPWLLKRGWADRNGDDDDGPRWLRDWFSDDDDAMEVVGRGLDDDDAVV